MSESPRARIVGISTLGELFEIGSCISQEDTRVAMRMSSERVSCFMRAIIVKIV